MLTFCPRGVLAAALVLLAPVPAWAQEQPPQIDLDEPCGSAALPAVSADGRLVAFVRCWSDLSDASDVTFQLVRVRDGRVARTIQLQSAATGGENPTPEGLVRRAVRRANRVLAAAGFRSLVPMVDEGGNAEHIEQGFAAGLRATITAHLARIEIADAADGRPRATRVLPSFPSHPYCCGYDEPDWQTAQCGLTPIVQHAWADAAAAVVVVEAAAWDGPDGCEEGPLFEVIALSP